MNSQNCYLCEKSLPQGQSYYEDHGHRVCLTCFKGTPRCARCRFPGKELVNTPPKGMLCEFCRQVIEPEASQHCSFCKGEIRAGESHYEGHGEVVCIHCFKQIKTRCFTCRFPQIEKQVEGIGGVCKHCLEKVIGSHTNLEEILAPLYPFLQGLGHDPQGEIKGVFLAPLIILGMQEKAAPPAPIEFLDEYVQFAMPAWYMKDLFYLVPMLTRDWFIASMTGQLAARDLCRRQGLPDLNEPTAYNFFARSWCLFVSHQTAKKLKFSQVEKRINRQGEILPDFNKLLAMSEHRSLKEVIRFAQAQLSSLAPKSL